MFDFDGANIGLVIVFCSVADWCLLEEGDPVGAVAGFLGYGVNLVDLAVGVAPPGVVPTGTHIHV